jgi:hypothetical protein
MKSFGVEPMLAPIGEASMDDLDAEEEASLRSQAEYDKYHASHDDEDDGLDFSKFTGKKKEIDPSNIKSTPVTDEHEELMRMIAEIGHAQDIGASKAMIKNRAGEDVQMRYDVNKLQAMPSSSIRKIHAKVIGESEEIVEAVEDEIDSDMADWLEYLKRSIK